MLLNLKQLRVIITRDECQHRTSSSLKAILKTIPQQAQWNNIATKAYPITLLCLLCISEACESSVKQWGSQPHTPEGRKVGSPSLVSTSSPKGKLPNATSSYPSDSIATLAQSSMRSKVRIKARYSAFYKWRWQNRDPKEKKTNRNFVHLNQILQYSLAAVIPSCSYTTASILTSLHLPQRHFVWNSLAWKILLKVYS